MRRLNACRVRGSSLNRWPYSSLTMSNSAHLLVPAARFLRPGFATSLHSPRIEGWAERRETFGCSAEHPWGVHITRHARRLRGALRPMTQRTAGGNNVMISTLIAASVPIVSQTEIEPMKTALSLMLALITTTALPSRCPCRSRRGAGRLVPAQLYRERLILHAVAGRAEGDCRAAAVSWLILSSLAGSRWLGRLMWCSNKSSETPFRGL